jgi:hypothetical protein
MRENEGNGNDATRFHCMINNKGPRTETCGTPEETSLHVDVMLCLLFTVHCTF